jgi:RNA polymerase sigma-70 factor (ECF subfamily)
LAGDKDAIRDVIWEYGPGVRLFLAGHLFDPDSVDDLAQETFIAAYESLERFDPEADLGLWLKGIARNRLLMYLRRVSQQGKALEKLKAQVLQEVFPDVSRIQETDGGDTLDRLRECLGKLPEHARKVIEARHLKREKVSAIARRLETTVEAISSLLFRGRKQLEACIEGRR